MQINGQTKLYVIIGQPIGHTLSPAMHNAAFAALGYNGVYLPCPVQEDSLAEAVSGIRALGIRGGNVTIPFKEKIGRYLDGLTEQARIIGAVNTLYWEQDRLIGANTDGDGFLQALLRLEPAAAALPGAVVLGAGGSARAVAVSLVQAGLKRLVLVNRKLDKAGKLAVVLRDLGADVQVMAWNDPDLRKMISQMPLLINTTPLGMTAFPGSPPIDCEVLTPHHIVADLIYRPAETEFLQKAKSKGCRTMNGVGMLLEQGVLSFRLWIGREAPAGVMAQELARWL